MTNHQNFEYIVIRIATFFATIYFSKSENNIQNHFFKSKIHPIICFCKIKIILIGCRFLYPNMSIFQRSLWARRASVICGGATFHVRKRTFHAPMVRFMRQSRVVWLFYVVAQRAISSVIVQILK